MPWKRLILVLAVAGAVAVALSLDVTDYLQFDQLKSRLGELQRWRGEHALLSGLVFFLVYVIVTALSIPGAAVMTLAGGALFGFWYALLLVSFASTIGATLAFLVARAVLRDWVQQRFARQLRAINAGFARDGAFYLFSLRLVPVFPFFVVNLLMGLLPISVPRYYWVSQLGMLPGTAVYVNAGTRLGELESTAGILSPALLGSFLLLAVFPFLARGLLRLLRARRALAGFNRPRRFDTNLLVIGAGSAGLVAALIAATVRARVTLVERDRMGGDCLNTGCVPSKAFIRSSRIARYLRRAPEFGLSAVEPVVRFAEVMERVQRVIATIEPHDSVERFTGLGVDCVSGEARIVSPWEVEVDGRRISTRHIVIASGARPRVPEIPGLEQVDYLTSDNLWTLREQPRRLLVVGAGPIGCELAQAFAGLGTQVTVLTHADRLLPREDPEVGERLLRAFAELGMTVHTRWEPRAFTVENGEPGCVCDTPGGELRLAFDRVLLAVGRTPNIGGMGLEEVGVRLEADGGIAVDDFLATSVPTIYACGDVIGPYRFTHMASHQAWYAAVNCLFGALRRFRVDYSVVPWATFTDPEVARVGLSEEDARRDGVDHEVTCYDLGELDRAIADGEADGFVKVLTAPGSDRILGATIVGYHAAELIGEYVLAMKHGIGLNKILGTIHVYPTLGEANKFAAGEWRRARKPEGLLRWVARYHGWRRGHG